MDFNISELVSDDKNCQNYHIYFYHAFDSLNNRAKNGIRVVVGSAFLNSGGIAHATQDVILHPDFNSFQFTNDVAVLKTSTTIIFSATVKPILVGSSFVIGGLNVLFTGWVS